MKKIIFILSASIVFAIMILTFTPFAASAVDNIPEVTFNYDCPGDYTVEFTYQDHHYVMQGGTSIEFSVILDEFGLFGNVLEVESSDDDLFSAEYNSDRWVISSHKPFSTEERVRVTIDDALFEIVVTDSVTLLWPVPGHTGLSQGYHDNSAIDISDASIGGATVVAALGGTVTNVYKCGVQHYGYTNYNGCGCNGFGTGVVITGMDGRFYHYAHMMEGSIPSDISVGSSVSQGQTIGKVGTTGYSSGNHLHFAISKTQYGSEGIDPSKENYIYAIPAEVWAPMDVNFYVNGIDPGNLNGIGTIQVYVDGELQTTNGVGNYTDFCQHVKVGKPYEIRVNITNPDYYYAGVDLGIDGYTGLTGTTNENITYVRVVICKRKCEKVLPDGNYLIVTAGYSDKNTFYFLDAEGTDPVAPNETNVSICGPLIGEPPYFEIWSINYDNGSYSIKQYNTDMYLDVYGAWKNSETNVQVYMNSSQRWFISQNESNGYRIQAGCSGFSLDIKGGIIINGANIQQYPNSSGANQSWLFIPYLPSQPIEEGRYILLNSLSDNAEIDVEGDTGDISDNTNIQIWNDSAISRFNSFDFIKLENGYYKIRHVASGKCLTVSDGSSIYGSNVVLFTDNGSLTQQWAIEESGSGYTLICRCNGYALDLKSNSVVDGTNVEVYPIHGRPNQIWRFVSAEYTMSFDANGGTGVPSFQTKYYHENLTLSSIIPTRDGYTFTGWNTKADGTGTSYTAGASYTANASVTLYAQWIADDKILTLPAGLTTIETEAFKNTNAEAVRIPDTVNAIDIDAFDDKIVIITANDNCYAAEWAINNGHELIVE